MWELVCEEGWAQKNWCFWTVVLEKTLENSLDCKEIQPVHSKDQSCVFFGRTDDKAETLIPWPLHAKSWLFGKDWCWEGLGAGGEGDDRGWDGWMASLSTHMSLGELQEFTQTHVHRVRDAIQPSYPRSSPSPHAPNPSQHQSLFQWVNSSHEVAKVLEFQL